MAPLPPPGGSLKGSSQLTHLKRSTLWDSQRQCSSEFTTVTTNKTLVTTNKTTVTTNKTSLSQQQEPAAGTLVVFDQTLQIQYCRNLATCFLLDRIWISISIYVELTVNICQVDIVNIDNTKYETATTQATCFRSSSTAVLLLEQKKRKTIQTKLSQKKRRKISLKKIAYNVLYLLAPPSPLQSVNALIRHCPSTI